MPKLVLVIAWCLYTAFLQGQQPLHYNFTHYPPEGGLVSNQVNTAVQDEEGYLWVGTTDGLQRFDGIRYKTFRHRDNDSSSIPSNPVWELVMDKKSNLWLLMADGRVGIFDTKTFIFREARVRFKKPVSPNTFLKHLICDDSGHLFYLISGSEVITFNEETFTFSYPNNFFKQKEGWTIIDFVPQRGTQKYWLSIAGNGLAVYNKETDNLSYRGHNTEHEPAIDQATDNPDRLYFDKRGRLWFLEQSGTPRIYCYTPGNEEVKEMGLSSDIKAYHEINGFFEQQDGTVWVKGSPVFAKYIEAEGRFATVENGYKSEQSIAYEKVTCLYEDREMNIWVCTDNNGLYRFNPAKEYFSNVKHINRENRLAGTGHPTSFVFTRRGTVLAGTWGDGLYEYDSSFKPIASVIDWPAAMNPFIWSICASKDSNSIWISTEHGVYLIDQTKQASHVFYPDILSGKIIKQIVEDKNGRLWLGMRDAGVFKWDRSAAKGNFNEGIAAIKTIPPVQINAITVDSKGYIWVGTPENGIYVIDPGTDSLVMRFSDTSPEGKRLPERGVSSILEYSDSLVVITTATRVVLYNRFSKRTSVIGSAGTISGFITAAERDANGYLWITSTSGLYRVSLSNALFVKFGRRDGIENEHFIQSASARLSDGKMIFGTTNSIIVFDPAKIDVAWAMRAVNITDIRIMGKSRSVDSLMRLERVELSYRDNSLVIEFSPLVYSSPYLASYTLEGLEKNWHTADRNNEAIYSFLPPGSYTFLLRTVDEQGNKSDKITRLKITILHPFWSTWWFYSLVLLLVASLLFWLDRARMKKKEAVQNIRSNIAGDLYEDVNTALRNINILSEIARLKADKDTEQSKEFIEQIHSKSQQMIIAMDDLLWCISPENDSMQKTIDRLKEHIDLLRTTNHVEIDLLVDSKVPDLKLNMKLRQNIFWFLKSGSTNIVKTGATNCKIHVSLEKSHLLYTLEFDNAHADMQRLNNLLQREELANKLDEIKGKLALRVHKTITVIQLNIPIFEIHD